MVKLDTTEAVLEWARTQSEPYETDWGIDYLDDKSTAAYIAECVRLRQAFENVERGHTEHCAHNKVTKADIKVGECLLFLSDAMKGGGK